MATQEQVMTSVSQELHTLLVPPEQVRLDTPKLGLVVIHCTQDLLGKIAAHFGMVPLITLPGKYLPVTHSGWRLYLDIENEEIDSAV